VLVLGIETSSRFGSVALVEDGRLLAQASHDTPNAHGERLLGLIDALFEEAGRSRRDLTRVAVGRGPGSFTGLRIGLSLAQGIAIGLGIEAVGLGSLEAMALGLTSSVKGLRYTVLDARREEIFWACYRDNGQCLLEPSTVSRRSFFDALESARIRLSDVDGAATTSAGYLLGAVTDELLPEQVDREKLIALGLQIHRSTMTDFPSAIAVAVAACSSDRSFASATPEYLRDADAIKPNLPPCPLQSPRP
jgi:tRNA threonylcarbamoyl adenosine modification protein YeaZ